MTTVFRFKLPGRKRRAPAQGLYFWDRKRRDWIKDRPAHEAKGPVTAIVGDLGAYRSMATGEMVDGRAQHREHLRRHRLIEVGNERGAVDSAPQIGGMSRAERVQDIKRAAEQSRRGEGRAPAGRHGEWE